MTTTATATNPILNLKTTWKQVISSSDDVVGLNMIHPQVIGLLHAASKDKLTDSAQKDLKLNSIMFMSTFAKWPSCTITKK